MLTVYLCMVHVTCNLLTSFNPVQHCPWPQLRPCPPGCCFTSEQQEAPGTSKMEMHRTGLGTLHAIVVSQSFDPSGTQKQLPW